MSLVAGPSEVLLAAYTLQTHARLASIARLAPCRRLAGAFDGTEEPGDTIPVWVVEAVVRGRLPAKPEDKCAFVLRPAEVRRVGTAAASAECTADPGAANHSVLSAGCCWCRKLRKQAQHDQQLVLANSHGMTAGMCRCSGL